MHFVKSNLAFFSVIGCQSGKALLWDVRKARNCLMSFDMGYLKGKDKKRVLQESMAHKGTVNGLAFTNTGT